MNLMTKTFTFLCLMTMALTAQAKDLDFSQMTETEQQATGIDKLTPDEQEALLRWITQKQQALIIAERKKNLGLEKKDRKLEESAITAQLVKQYSNQVSQKFYQLSNGQIWKQTSSGHITISRDGPQMITIEPGFMGSWTLKGEGNRSVKVKRIK